MAYRMTPAGRSCCRPAIHGRHRVVRVMVKPQPRAVGWFQRQVSPDPAPPPKIQLDVLATAVGVIVTVVGTVLMVSADLKTDLKADITSVKMDIKTLSDKLDKYNQVSEKNAKQAGLVDQLQKNVNIVLEDRIAARRGS